MILRARVVLTLAGSIACVSPGLTGCGASKDHAPGRPLAGASGRGTGGGGGHGGANTSGAGAGGKGTSGGTGGGISVEDAGAAGACERQVTLKAVVLGEPAPFDLVLVADHSQSLAWSRDELSAGLHDLLTNVQGRAVRVFLLTPTQYGASSAAARLPLTGDPAVAWQDPATLAGYEGAMTTYAQNCTDPDGAEITCPDPRGKVPYEQHGEWSFVMRAARGAHARHDGRRFCGGTERGRRRHSRDRRHGLAERAAALHARALREPSRERAARERRVRRDHDTRGELVPGSDISELGAYFKSKAAQVFGPGKFLVEGIVFEPSFSCALGEGQSYATNIGRMIGDATRLFPLCESYAPALKGVLDFAQALIQTEFTLSLADDEHVTAVVVIAKDGSERALDASQYTFTEATGLLEIEPSALRGTDANLRVEVTSDCRPSVR